MTEQSCPACGANTLRRFDGISANTDVWYWRCDQCGHIWTVSKTDETDIEHISPLPPKKTRANGR